MRLDLGTRCALAAVVLSLAAAVPRHKGKKKLTLTPLIKRIIDPRIYISEFMSYELSTCMIQGLVRVL